MESSVVYCEPFGGGERRAQGVNIVPWISWDEWNFVRESLFSSSHDVVASALKRVSAWKRRGCIPPVIDSTFDFISSQQNDRSFRVGSMSADLHLEPMLAKLYCMSIIRLVNVIIEKTRKRDQLSIAEAAIPIGMPRELIDLRHEASHYGEFPSLKRARLASNKALDWLKSFYWEPQRNSVLLQWNDAANVRKEIDCKLCEFVVCLKSRQTNRPISTVKAKGMKRVELLSGSKKFFSLAAGMRQSLKSGGSKKSLNGRMVKQLIQLYYLHSSEVISVLLELLTKAINVSASIDCANNLQTSQRSANMQTSIDDWKPLIIRLSKKEPDLLRNLITSVVDIINQALEVMKNETNEEILVTENEATNGRVKQLCSLIAWFIRNLEDLKPRCYETEISDTNMPLPRPTMIKLIRTCLAVSAHGHYNIMGSSTLFAQLLKNNTLIEKLTKLSNLNQNLAEESSCLENSENFLKHQEDSVRQASEKLDFMMDRRAKEKMEKRDDVASMCRWNIVKLWAPCPIGMLPGFPYNLPVLDCDSENNDHVQQVHEGSEIEGGMVVECEGRREASCDAEMLDSVSHNEMKETFELRSSVKGCLMISGILKKIDESELLAIQSSVRVLL